MFHNKKIFCTLGPSSLNPLFLKNIKKKVSLLRLNLSHIETKNITNIIKYIRRFTPTPICIDTEGAQIRTKVRKKIFLKKNQKNYLGKNCNFNLYPPDIIQKINTKDILDVGFDGLKIKILHKNGSKRKFRVINSGTLETNKGVHIINRKINLDFLTEKDKLVIGIAKKMKINNYALSFTNTAEDIKKFNIILPRKSTKIFKIETKEAITNIKKFAKIANNFLIDRGDLSKDIGIMNIPFAQKYIINQLKVNKKNKIFIATNYLETMINNSLPTRAEINDIYSSINSGADGIVLAAETAIGKYPLECVNLLDKFLKHIKKRDKKWLK